VIAGALLLGAAPAAGLALAAAAPSLAAGVLHGAMAVGGAAGGARDAAILPRLAAGCAHALAVTAAAAALAALLARRRGGGVPRALLLGLVAADLHAVNGRLNPTVEPEWYRAEPRLVATIQEIDAHGRVARLPRPAGFALRLRPGAGAASAGFLWDRMSLRNATVLLHGLRLGWDRNNDRLNPGASADVSRRLEEGAPPAEAIGALRLGGIRFVVAYETLDAPGLRPLDAVRGESSHPLLLYGLADPLPRARVVGRLERVAGAPEALARVLSPAFDPAGTLLLVGPPGPAEGRPAGVPAEIVVDEPGRVEVRTAAPFDGWLVLADTFYPGWRAEVDGIPAEIEAAYGMFRAVRLSAGEHRVKFRYAPASLGAGAALSAAALLGTGIAALRRRGVP
jgi:hypothetical protein